MSGVGNAELLRQLDIKVVSDLPGVGEEYQDHYTTLTLYRVSNETVTTDVFLRGVKEVQKELFAEWETSPEKARLSSNSIDAGLKIRPTGAELKKMGPEFNELWDRYFKNKPDKPVMFGSIVSGGYADHTLLPPGKSITMFQYLEYPASRGKIHVKSQNPYSYKKTREIARRMDAFRGELTSHHPHFHPASPAAAKDIDIRTAKEIYPDGLTVGIHMGTWHKPGEPYDASKEHEDIVYTKEHDEAVDNCVADPVETTWHSMGTCVMKLREQGGAVDKRMSDNLGTNTYSSALLVGEKAADLIVEELGLKLRISHVPVPHAPIPTGKPSTQQVR
ncbi:Alcohol oxidase [Sparassis crispa]|uniref:Alcohol oxidase n=1 Tax=Sparassis crispa TaxID=139825 RepID=A0A401GWH2_9APHY|nr:Alcohol oxidase [Sparassis crispa]GBE86114.1 Alcohol oxidase [Sparassis crispa]